MGAISPKCLFFDVFGTCVDWRKSVTDTLSKSAKEALQSPQTKVSSEICSRAEAITYEQWGELAQEWRNGYLAFTRQIAADPSKAYKTVDQHHLESLHEILAKWNLISLQDDGTAGEGSLWTEDGLQELNLVWHRLAPWPDTCEGLQELKRQVYTCTLTNGNLSLIQAMCANGNMGFTHIYSAEMFESYKPNPKIYLGAAEKMGLKPEECAMVAAHLDDLKAAKAVGFSAIYVERPREERQPELRGEGIPDIWVKEGEGGFVTVAERLRIRA